MNETKMNENEMDGAIAESAQEEKGKKGKTWIAILCVVVFVVVVIVLALVLLNRKKPYEADFSEDSGDVLNIAVYNEEFIGIMEEYYPDYDAESDWEGEIGDVTVRFTYIPTGDDFQELLEEGLEERDEDERIDMFIVEPRFSAEYFTFNDYCLSMEELELTDYMEDQFGYFINAAMDEEGNVNGIAYESFPGMFVYNRDIADEVFGTDDPEEVQEYLADWDRFVEAAEMLEEEGYYITSSYDSHYRIFAERGDTPWVVDDVLQVPEAYLEWAELTKEMYEEDYMYPAQEWSWEWMELFYDRDEEFGYFSCPWHLEYTLIPWMSAEEGDWAACAGPEAFIWGGQILCASADTDNPGLVRDIMYQLCCNPEVMMEMAEDGHVVNNRVVMEEMVEEEEMTSEFLDDQSLAQIYLENSENAVFGNHSLYDAQLDTLFKEAMNRYIVEDEDLEDALEEFYEMVEDVFPDIEIDD